MHVTNVGGSLTTAVCLSLIAWSVRVLRSSKPNLLKDLQSHLKSKSTANDGSGSNENKATSINSIKQKARNAARHESYARLSPLAFWLLVGTKPVEFFIVDVSDRNENSDLVRALQRRFISEEKEEEANVNRNKSLYYVRMDLSEVQLLLRNRNSPSSASSTFRKRYPRTKTPGLRSNLIFVSPHGKHAAQAAAQASSLGFSRCSTVVGGMVSLIPLLDSDMKSLLSEEDVSLSRDAFMTLLESTHLLSSGGAVIIDIRRYDERVYYGSVRGTVHMLVDHIPKALLLGDEDWFRSFRFPKPKPETFVVLLTSSSSRANWARQVFSDAGVTNVKTYSVENGFAWAQHSRCTKYEMFEEGEKPPEIMDLGNNLPFSRAKGEGELRIENVLVS
jgi:rhodanese-related sulfurtransferase